jgi:hypothetical protein
MMKVVSLLVLFASLALFGSTTAEQKVYSNETLTSCSYDATCSSGGYDGVCVSVSAGCCSGVTASGLCPGSSDIKCCTQSTCSTPSGTGTCMQTSKCSSEGGTSVSGYCTGPSDIQCCVTGLPPAPTGEYGVDISDAMSSSTGSCYKSSGITFVIPRGYRSTGAVDTNVCTSLVNAKAVGITKRETYMFPCPTCSKSAAQQMNELVSHLQKNCAESFTGRVWLDIEGSQYWLGSSSKNQAWYKVKFYSIWFHISLFFLFDLGIKGFL